MAPPKRAQAKASASRKVETRDEKPKSDGFLSVSFKFFKNNDGDDGVGQSLTTWFQSGNASDIVEALHYITTHDATTLQQEKRIEIYGSFPSNVSKFKCPDDILPSEKWAVIRNFGGQMYRIAGFVKERIFYVVFLDKEHKFYPTKNNR